MIYLLDTNTCIHYMNGQSQGVHDQLESKRSADIILCSIVKAELFYGAVKSAHPEANLAKLRAFADRFVSLPFDDDAARIYGALRARLKSLGTPIGPNDLLIASIAVANDAILVSHNTREFSRVAELKQEDWE